MVADGSTESVSGVEVRGDVSAEFAKILTPSALSFVAYLERTFNRRRRELLQMRDERQEKIDAGIMPDFLPHTDHIRNSDWAVASKLTDLEDRRVDIIGSVDRKMIINALNSGANVFMADFEDSHSPTWAATIEGQIHLKGTVDGIITYTAPNGKFYQLQSSCVIDGPTARLAS